MAAANLSRYGASPNGDYSGTSYVVFGHASGFASNIDLSSLDGATGFKLSGAAAFDFSGSSVASAGDVNGDGFADLIVGAGLADANGVPNSGASYVVFGRASGFAANTDLSALDGTNGFRLNGAALGDRSGYTVASAGDVIDFAGNGASAGDSLQFVGYGSGATFTQNDATHWQITYNGGSSVETITFMNGASIHASDFLFS